MRIITGRFKGMALFIAPGFGTRPTTSFQREMIFSMIADFEGKRVLDLFAGTGGLGLEALSRGASWVDFVEFSSSAISVLLKNIRKLNCGDECHVHRQRVETFIRRSDQSWDLIFLDPPYDKDLVNPCLIRIMESQMLRDDALVLCEHSSREKLEPSLEKYLLGQKTGKTISLSLLQKPQELPVP